jgi:hypothetical protein
MPKATLYGFFNFYKTAERQKFQSIKVLRFFYFSVVDDSNI